MNCEDGKCIKCSRCECTDKARDIIAEAQRVAEDYLLERGFKVARRFHCVFNSRHAQSYECNPPFLGQKKIDVICANHIPNRVYIYSHSDTSPKQPNPELAQRMITSNNSFEDIMLRDFGYIVI